MYKLLLACLLFANSLTAQEPSYNPSIDVLHYRFLLSVSDSNDVVQGDAFVQLRFTKTSDQLYLDLVSLRSNGKGMTVTAVKENDRPLSFVHRNDSLLVNMQAKEGDTREVEIAYSGIPADGLIFSKNKSGSRTIFGDNWPNRARNWLPCKDHLSDKATVEFVVTAPGHYKIVANGLKLDETAAGTGFKTTHWKESVPIPTKVMVIGAADFAVSEPVMVNDIAVTSWIFPEQKEAGFADYAPAADILSYFIKNIGPYSYEKLANVQSKTIFGGMENAGAIFYAESSVSGRKRVTGLLAHEIAHQWFGDAATEKDWPHIWLSEGFATEMSQRYLEHLYGNDTVMSMLKNNRRLIIAFTKKERVPVVDTTKGKNIMKLLNTNSYQKGGWVLHMLRTQLGDALFWKCVQAYYARYRDKNASSADFQQVIEEVSGRSWKNFFQQWLYIPENPALKISWRYDESSKEVIVSVAQQTDHLFSISLDVRMTDEKGNSSNSSLPFAEKTTEFRIPFNSKPTSFETDPFCRLLFEEVKS
jgi:aminopeptidase N